MAAINLTNAYIRTLQVTTRIEIWDATTNGLILRASPNGSRTFVYRYRSEERKKYRRLKIGTWPDLSLADARKRVQELKQQRIEGEDPVIQIKMRNRQIISEYNSLITVAELVDKFKKSHFPTIRKPTQLQYTRLLEVYVIPVFGKRHADTIRRRDVLELMDYIADEEKLPTTANKVKAIMSVLYSFAVEREYVTIPNPAKEIRMRRDGRVKRDRYYSEEELVLIWRHLQEEPDPERTYYMMLLYMGQRKSETVKAKWEHIDLVRKTWRIPKENSKTHNEHVLPLPEEAVGLLQNLHKVTGDREYVFSSSRLLGTHLKYPDNVARRLRNKEGGISDFRMHDLRRTMATHMAMNGIPQTTIGHVLNHKGLSGADQITAIYNRHDYMPEKREALNRWCSVLHRIVDGMRDEARIITLYR